MLEVAIIQPSTSPYSSHAILVKKKDSSWRFSVDYRVLNKINDHNKFPFSVVGVLLDEIGGANVFSKLNLRSEYHQIRMKEEVIAKSAFRTHESHNEFMVLPFGINNTPSYFQSLMNEVLSSILEKYVLVFTDDILINTSSLKDQPTKYNDITATKCIKVQR